MPHRLPPELKAIALPTTLMAAYGFSGGLLRPILSPYVKSAGFSDIHVSMIFAVFPLALILISPIIGKISDDIGRYSVIFAGMVSYLAAFALFFIDGHVLVFVAAQIMAAVSAVAVSTVSLARIEDVLPDGSRGRYSGIALSVSSVALMTGSLTGGFVADSFGIRAPLLLGMLTIALAATFAFFHRGSHPEPIDRRDLNVIENIRDFLSVKKLQGMAVLGFFMHAKGEALTVFFPLFVLEELGLSFNEIGIAMFLLGGFHVFQFIFGSIVDRHGSETAIIAGVLVTSVSMMSFPLTSNIYVIYAIFAFYSIGGSFWNVAAWTLMSDIGEARGIEGEVMGSYVSLAKMGAFTSLMINGIIVTLWGFRTLFILHGILTAIAAFVAYFLLRD